MMHALDKLIRDIKNGDFTIKTSFELSKSEQQLTNGVGKYLAKNVLPFAPKFVFDDMHEQSTVQRMKKQIPGQAVDLIKSGLFKLPHETAVIVTKVANVSYVIFARQSKSAVVFLPFFVYDHGGSNSLFGVMGIGEHDGKPVIMKCDAAGKPLNEQVYLPQNSPEERLLNNSMMIVCRLIVDLATPGSVITDNRATWHGIGKTPSGKTKFAYRTITPGKPRIVHPVDDPNPAGTHSPHGEHTVRGHIRRYKSGKEVWIDAHKRGSGPCKTVTLATRIMNYEGMV